METMPFFMPCLHDQQDFVLTVPDSEASTIKVDASGTVTGIIDWDYALISPRYLARRVIPASEPATGTRLPTAFPHARRTPPAD